MIQRLTSVLPYSLLYISDADYDDPPEPDGSLICASESCVIVSCVAFSDSATEVIFGLVDELARNDMPAFDSILKVPSRELVLSTAENDALLSAAVADSEVRVRIWLNRPVEPDIVTVGLG